MVKRPLVWDEAERGPLKLVGFLSLVAVAALFTGCYLTFNGVIGSTARLTVLTMRSGLTLDVGSKVTLNGVRIGRVADVEEATVDGSPGARVTLAVDPRFLAAMPANVGVDIRASTVFGTKTVSLSSPEHPLSERIDPSKPLIASTVTTEINTLFETLVSIASKVDPIKLNQTLTAAAQAVDGDGARFGRSLQIGDDILNDLNPRMPQLNADVRGVADLSEVYANAAPDLLDALQASTTVAHSLTAQQRNLDAALMSAVGLANTSADVVERSAPDLVRGNRDFVPTSALGDEYSPEIFCTIRNYHDLEPEINKSFGANGYSTVTRTELVGVGNPYIYPDNLPRVNAHGGPEGKPGCWQPITRNLWPHPYLVMDTGASIAPYNHFGLGQPIANDYVWGRQIGENTINP